MLTAKYTAPAPRPSSAVARSCQWPGTDARDREHPCGAERRERERADVEQHVVQGRAPCAPLDHGGGDRDRERGARAEQGRSCDRADRSDRDRPLVELQRERLPDPDERDDCDEAEDVLALAEHDPEHAGGDAEHADEADQHCEPRRERQEARPVHRVRPRVTALGVRLDLQGGRDRSVMLAVLRHRDEPRRALFGHEERLGARAEHAVAALELRAVDGEVGLVDQLVRIGAVLRVAGDADRDGGPDRLARGLDVEVAFGDGAADPLGDLERLLGRGLRQEDRELLAAEARRDVVVAKLGPEDLRDPLQDRVPRQVAVVVVDVPEQVEVGHDQRERPLEALRPAELLLQRQREMTRVEEAGLRIDTRLSLQAPAP